MKIVKVKEMSPQAAMIISAIIISLSIFITGWIFLSKDTVAPKTPTPTTQRTLTPEQVKKIQEERAAQMQKKAPTPSTTAETEEEN